MDTILEASTILGGAAALLYIILWVLDWWRTRANRAPTIRSAPVVRYVAYLLAVILVLVLPRGIIQMWTDGIPSFGSPADIKRYAVSVFVYKDSLGKGRPYGTGDTQQPNVEVVVHDTYHQELSEMTDKDGKALIMMPTPGDISVGVCGISQTHHVSDKADMINPYPIKVGVQPRLLEVCRQPDEDKR